MASSTLVWITGASSGIGRALAASAPFDDATVYDVSRSGGAPGATHVAADLSDPASWSQLAEQMRAALAEHNPDRAVLVHCAGTLDPMGPAGTVDQVAYASNVVLNSAAPQVVGNGFLTAVREAGITDATAVFIGSGAASKPYEGWSSYCAAKAGQDHWVRTVGAEQAGADAPVKVVSVAPGVVATNMQEFIRQQDAGDFPSLEKFVGLHERGELVAPEDAAAGIWSVVERDDITTGAVVDLRTLAPAD